MDLVLLLEEINTAVPTERKDALRSQLAAYVNDLLLHDFAALVQVLYRVDVSEKRLKALLLEKPNEDAGNLIASLLLQRQQEKAEARKKFQSSTDNSDEERW